MRFISEEGGVHQYYPLREGSLIVGRHSSCNVVIPGRNVSKKHLQCYVENGVVTIRDLGSSNGTFVNGAPVTSCVLKDGDQVSLGGYRLVLDLELGGATAPPPPGPAAPAQPAFDYEPSRPPQAAPDAPLNFDKPPSGDDTPADGAFVPQTYAPPQSLQPQIVARDGHMYLRDPRTNREVEIVPRRAGVPADLTGYYAEKEVADKKRNRLLIIGAIGVALLMILALVFTSSTTDTTVKTVPKAFPSSRYHEIADQSIDQMTAGNFQQAIEALQSAHKEYPSYQVAAILIEIGKQWKKSGKTRDEFNWLSVKSALDQLKESRWATAKVKAFANDRFDWIYNMEHQESIVQSALNLVKAGDPEKALDEFKKLPDDSPVRRKHIQKIADIVAACYAKHLAAAREAADRMQWTAAIEAYKTAGKYATELQRPDLDAGIRAAEKRLLEDDTLKNANIRLRENTPASLQAALTLLDGVDDTGPYGARKSDLRRRIDAALADLRGQEVKATALAAYKAGRGREAITIITSHSLTELYPTRTRIEKLERIQQEARAAQAAKDYDLAKEKWAEAAGEEPAADNTYHRTAVDELTKLGNQAPEIALEYNARADAALKADDPETARKFYLKAMRWDPRAVAGKEGLASLRHLAEVYYNQARDLRYSGQKAQAIELFAKVLRYAQEGDNYYRDAKRHLGELRAENPAPQ